MTVKKSSDTPKEFERLFLAMEGVEWVERYRPGGYHPLNIGDILQSRYHIVHKLGFGTYSTVWLARDQSTAKYVAIKILVASDGSQRAEKDILRSLSAQDSSSETSSRPDVFPLLLDEFEVVGPNGTHTCLVTLPARMSVAAAIDASYNKPFQLPVARAIAAQLVQGVAFLHSKGIVHSDIHTGNILLRLPNSINHLTPEQLYEKYPLEDPEPIERIDKKPLDSSVPPVAITPVWLGENSDKVPLSESRILLSDFGESFEPSVAQRYHCHAPPVVRPPEALIPGSDTQKSVEPISFPADIWMLACAIFSILGERDLFEVPFSSEDWAIKEHVEVLGKLPSEWWGKWETRAEWYDEDGQRKDGSSPRSLEERYEDSIQEPRRNYKMEELSDEEGAALVSLLKSMLLFNPQDRATAKEVLESEWMKRWALLDLERIQNSD